MAKRSHSVQLVESFPSDQEIYKKNIKLNWKRQFGACNGVLSQPSMINHFVLWDAGIKLFTTSIVMDKRNRSSIKDVLAAIQFQSTFTIQVNTL